ncbi:MAG: DUF2807 domain-containing protein [Bacteroidales bacterium]|jgi:hypothetical protein|nr:DUF2807 domain-containing protein [Bacteroidales bacterium]
MKNKSHLILLLLAGFLLSCCTITFVLLNGDRNITEKVIPIANFNRISCLFPLTVQYSQADTTVAAAAMLKTDANLAEYIDIRVENGTLMISQKQDKEYRNYNLRPSVCELIINSSVLTGISVAGNGEVNIVTPFNSRSVQATIAGSGRINFLYDVTTDRFINNISGSGKMSTYKLQAARVNISIRGSGEAFMDEVYSDNFSATVSGSGNIESNTLHAHQISNVLSGSGTILNGKVKCEIFRASINGSGTILAEGVAKESNFALVGSGKIDCSNLTANTVNNAITGSGQVYITAIEKIDSSIMGSGQLFFGGEPRRVNNTVQGSGGTKPIKSSNH